MSTSRNHADSTSTSSTSTFSNLGPNVVASAPAVASTATASPPPLRTAAQIKAEREEQKKLTGLGGKEKGKGKGVIREEPDIDIKSSNTMASNPTQSATNKDHIVSKSIPGVSTSNPNPNPNLRPNPNPNPDPKPPTPTPTYTHRKKTSISNKSQSHLRTQSNSSTINSNSTLNSNPPSQTSSPFINHNHNHNLPIPLPSHSAWSAGSVTGSNSYASASASSNQNSNGTNTPDNLSAKGVMQEEQIDSSSWQSPVQMANSTESFQPGGLIRNRFHDFEAIRKIEVNGGSGQDTKDLESLKRIRKREEREREEGRLGRRLEKLLSLHYDPATSPLVPSDASSSPFLSSTISTLSRSSKFLTLTSSSLGLSPTASKMKELRNLEKEIVPWQKDSDVKTCPICGVNFNLAIRKHHCRLCGRVVCANEPLSLGSKEDDGKLGRHEPAPFQMAGGGNTKKKKKCSNLMVLSNPPDLFNPDFKPQEKFNPSTNSKIRDIRTTLTPHQKEELVFLEKRRKKILNDRERELDSEFQKRKEEEWEKERENERIVGIRACKECREILLRKQFRIANDGIPRYLQRYQDLVQLQKEIEQSLPEFQEMVLGLQKQDQTTALGSSSKASLSLQRDAAQARKQLLINFANYDRIAKEIKNLPDEIEDEEELDSGGFRGGNGNANAKESGTDGAQKRVKMAIFMRANLFLQQNMFPLQRLPKPGENTTSSASSERSSLDRDQNLPNSSTSTSSANPTSTPTRSLRSLIAGSGPNSNSEDLQNRQISLTPSGVDPTIPIEELRTHLSVIIEQREKVESFANAAERLRKFEDAGMLRKSAGELRVEEERFRKRLRELGEKM